MGGSIHEELDDSELAQAILSIFANRSAAAQGILKIPTQRAGIGTLRRPNDSVGDDRRLEQ